MSLPLRECGLKSHDIYGIMLSLPVTPLAGVWIEITMPPRGEPPFTVTPLAGVWIEIPFFRCIYHSYKVTPLAGVWIEMAGHLALR